MSGLTRLPAKEQQPDTDAVVATPPAAVVESLPGWKTIETDMSAISKACHALDKQTKTLRTTKNIVVYEAIIRELAALRRHVTATCDNLGLGPDPATASSELAALKASNIELARQRQALAAENARLQREIDDGIDGSQRETVSTE